MVHSFAEDECAAFVDFINSRLAYDPELSYLLPMNEYIELFGAITDGVLLCRLVNEAQAETIDERVVNMAPNNRFLITEVWDAPFPPLPSLSVNTLFRAFDPRIGRTSTSPSTPPNPSDSRLSTSGRPTSWRAGLTSSSASYGR